MTDDPTPETEPTTAPESTVDEARALLAWCKDNGPREDALETFIALGPWLARGELAREVIDTAEAVIRPILAATAPPVAAQALMIIALSALLNLDGYGARVDALFLGWMRHPSSYGPGRATPKEFQRPEFVQRVADLLGWGELDVQRDRDALARFAAWIGSWSTGNRFKVRRIVNTLQRNFGARGVWEQIRFG